MLFIFFMLHLAIDYSIGDLGRSPKRAAKWCAFLGCGERSVKLAYTIIIRAIDV
ncbi:unknown protein [Microcystis aeruginosa NIES-843]|uniref:Uncharacterized protein n=1 Tax=Microcystis aeruginosa (strain NIES-843 / IAM M-2473) TaxID=449447 RepID=B0JQA9_MICAN|nr:unknown protein [Microcystis aeruginosa NIES-843]